MAKIKLAHHGKVLKRSLLRPSTVVERMEYPGLTSDIEELVHYDVATIILHGQVTHIEKQVGTKLWYQSMEEVG